MKVNWEIVKIRGFIKEYFDEYAEVDRCEKTAMRFIMLRGRGQLNPHQVISEYTKILQLQSKG